MMRIPCSIDDHRHILVDGYFVCTGMGIRGPVVFTIDTGSPVTSLGHRDAMALGLDVRGLQRAPQRFFGLGGFSETFEIPDVDIIVTGGGEQAVCHMGFVYYHRSVRKVKRKTSGAMVYQRERVAAAPSILGADALAKLELVLEVNFAAKTALLRSPLP